MSNAQRTGAYNEGKAAFEAGTPVTDNPHQRGENSLRRAWNWGWTEAKEGSVKENSEETTAGVADALQPGQTLETVPDPDAVKAHPDATTEQLRLAEEQQKALEGEPVNLGELAKDLDTVSKGETEDKPKTAQKKAPARKPAAKKAAPKADSKPATEKLGDAANLDRVTPKAAAKKAEEK